MASPFKKKSPLNAYKYSLTSEYADPTQVVQPLVGNEITKKIGEEAKNVSNSYKKAHSDKLAKKALDEAGNLKHQRAMEVKWGKGNTGPAVKPASHEENMSNFGLTGFKEIQAERDAKDFMNRDFGGNKDPNSLVSTGRAGRTFISSQGSNKNTVPQTFKGGIKTGKNIGYIPNKEEVVEPKKRRSVAMMKGSPNKLIEDTMDPYGQPQRGNRDFIFNEKGIAPGTLGNQASVGVQNEIYPGGQAQVAAEQLAAEQLKTPLYSKDHGVKQAHTHPTKTTTKMKPDGEYPGAKYVKGDIVDQDDLLEKTELDAHIATQVQSDKKGTFIKEKSDDGPGSDIETSKGFGKKIRLGSMGRSSYTSNMKDQLDPHDFLFKNTPKK